MNDPINDPRHGTVAGYNRIPCRESCCRLAMANYRKRYEWDRLNGKARVVSTRGARRRVQALSRLGWSYAKVAATAGISGTNLTRLLKAETITSATFSRIDSAYKALHMELPTENPQAIAYVRNHAERMGWAPPLMWDDIDNDPAPCTSTPSATCKYDIDPAVVLRVLSGENLPTTKAERVEIMRRWLASGRTEKSLCDRIGWKSGRYVEREAIAS